MPHSEHTTIMPFQHNIAFQLYPGVVQGLSLKRVWHLSYKWN